METWLVPREELTNEQINAVELKPDSHRLVFGAPGSGKTIILLHRAHFLCDAYRIPPERFRIFVFTNVLKNYIKSALYLLRLPDDSVLTFDDWCRKYYLTNIEKRVPWDYANKCPDYPAIRRAVFNKLQSEKAKPIYDFVLVDEGQDLDGEAFEIMKLIARHVTVCMDHKQRIYEQGCSESEILNTLGLNRRNMSFLSAFRCCPYIVNLAAELIEVREERENFIRQSRTEQTEKQTPVLYYASSPLEETTKLIEAIKVRQQRSERIAVLFYQKRHVYGYAKGLKAAGLEVEVPKGEEGGNYRPIDFTSDRPKVLTFHSAKGLTFDTVIMPQLVNRSFFRRGQADVNRLLFVGITRATKWVYMISNERDELPFLKNLRQNGQRDWLAIQRGEQQTPIQNAAQTVTVEENDLLDML